MNTRNTIMLPDWACTPNEDYVVAALGGEEKLRKETLHELCDYMGTSLVYYIGA